MTGKHKFILLVLMTVWCVQEAIAQTGTDWLENTMFSSGKINVVVAVVATVFVLMVVYLIAIDRKLKKLEEREKNEPK